MATPPQGRKMAPERPFPILIETGKSYSKTGLSGGFSDSSTPVFQRFCRRFPPRFSSAFPAVLPTVYQRFSNGFPAVFRRFDGGFASGFASGLPTVFSASSTAVFRRFCQWSPGSFPAVLPTVFRRFDSGFPDGFLGKFDGGLPAVFRQQRFPWINPGDSGTGTGGV